MRCPQCGFISFDHLEVCKNCQKNLSELAVTIFGPTRDATAPLFLTISSSGTLISASEKRIKMDNSAPDIAGSHLGNFDKKSEPGFSRDNDRMSPEPRQEIEFPERVDAQLLNLNDEAREDESSFQVDEPMKKEALLFSVDFGDLDISDLAPSFQPPSFEKETEKESCNLNELECETPVDTLIIGATMGHRILPSVKTGTALDTFDVNLEEVFGDKK